MYILSYYNIIMFCYCILALWLMLWDNVYLFVGRSKPGTFPGSGHAHSSPDSQPQGIICYIARLNCSYALSYQFCCLMLGIDHHAWAPCCQHVHTLLVSLCRAQVDPCSTKKRRLLRLMIVQTNFEQCCLLLMREWTPPVSHLR